MRDRDATPIDDRRLHAPSWRMSALRTIDLERDGPALMGVLNATPDSFSDGGHFIDPALGAARAVHLVEEGAAIIDVGGESTRPGAVRVPAEEQIRRTVDLVRRIRSACDAAITIDTTSADVAAAALDAGADAVNDVSAGTDDPAMLPLVAARGAGIVLMHRVLPPEEDRWSHEHREPLVAGDIVRSVADHLLARVDAALAAGVDRGSIAIDPGLGFGKTVEQNFALVARIAELADLGLPIVFGASRKSFLGAATGRAAPLERVVGGVVAASIACAACPLIVRTHDVTATRDGLRTMQAVRAASFSP